MDSEYVMGMLKLRFGVLLFLLACGIQAWAYPNYVSFGYHSCVSCHYNPMGNGPLNDYGKSVAATELTDRLFMSHQLVSDDEKLADMTGFLFGKPTVDWLRPSASYRGLYLDANPGKSSEKTQWINMDASATLVAKFLENDKFILVGNIGYAPTPLQEAGSGKSYKNFRSREYYAGYRYSPEFGVYAGLMDKAFGIRVPDHIAFSRTVTRLDQDDQTDGILLHLLTENWEVALQPFVGNLVQESKLREKGVAIQIGTMVADTTRLGASFAQSKSDFINRTMYALDARSGFGQSHSLLFEIGQVESTPINEIKTTDRYVFLQNQWLLHRGLSSILTAEMQQPNIKKNGEIYRFGPGVQYFPIYRMEFRADLYDTRDRSSAAYSDDTWMITGQVHIWF
ncbi:MAG: hypothetical protein ACXVA9_09110 [Bdellovibrionales bacterium]